MTMLEKLIQVLGDGQWHSTEELVEKVGHRFSATVHTAVKQHGGEWRNDVAIEKPLNIA